MTITASPLTWPVGWKRTPEHKRVPARFGKATRFAGVAGQGGRYISGRALTIAEGVQRVRDELMKAAIGMTDDDFIISTNLRLRLDGFPRGDQGEPKDPGVAVYWEQGVGTKVMAIDRYDRVADNLAAIAATLEAMRAIERHGGAEILDRAFTGFVALAAPTESSWRDVLGLNKNLSYTVDAITHAYRLAAAKAHPDRGGSREAMQRVNAARDAALKEIQP